MGDTSRIMPPKSPAAHLHRETTAKSSESRHLELFERETGGTAKDNRETDKSWKAANLCNSTYQQHAVTKVGTVVCSVCARHATNTELH